MIGSCFLSKADYGKDRASLIRVADFCIPQLEVFTQIGAKTNGIIGCVGSCFATLLYSQYFSSNTSENCNTEGTSNKSTVCIDTTKKLFYLFQVVFKVQIFF